MLLENGKSMRYFALSLIMTTILLTILVAYKNYNDNLIVDSTTKTETLIDSKVQIESEIKEKERKLSIQKEEEELMRTRQKGLSNVLGIGVILVLLIYLAKVLFKILRKKQKDVTKCVENKKNEEIKINFWNEKNKLGSVLTLPITLARKIFGVLGFNKYETFYIGGLLLFVCVFVSSSILNFNYNNIFDIKYLLSSIMSLLIFVILVIVLIKYRQEIIDMMLAVFCSIP